MITIVYAGLLAIMYACLTGYVAAGRYKYRVGLGNGGNPALTQRVRMHGNFAEHVPFALFLIFLVDYSQYSPVIVHVLGIVLVIARIFHVWGIHTSAGASVGRFGGTVLTIVIYLVCAVLLIWKFLVLRAVGL
jgi:uncharacterized protein